MKSDRVKDHETSEDHLNAINEKIILKMREEKNKKQNKKISRYRYLYDLAYDIITEKLPFSKYEKFAERMS